MADDLSSVSFPPRVCPDKADFQKRLRRQQQRLLVRLRIACSALEPSANSSNVSSLAGCWGSLNLETPGRRASYSSYSPPAPGCGCPTDRIPQSHPFKSLTGLVETPRRQSHNKRQQPSLSPAPGVVSRLSRQATCFSFPVFLRRQPTNCGKEKEKVRIYLDSNSRAFVSEQSGV